MKLTVEERVHEICQLLEKGKTVTEVCALVEHDHCTDEVFTSYIVAIRNGVARKEISSNYTFVRPKYQYVKKTHNSIFHLTKKVSDLIVKENMSNPDIVTELYVRNENYTEKEFYNFVASIRSRVGGIKKQPVKQTN